jgi:hypothetical protein
MVMVRIGAGLLSWSPVNELYTSLDFTDTFLETFGSKDFTAGERKAIRKALRLLDSDERHPSLRVHQLLGDLAACGRRRVPRCSG